LISAVIATLLTPPPVAGTQPPFGTMTPAPAPSSSAVAPWTAAPPHIMVIVEENREQQTVLGSPDAPFANRLASEYGSATSSFATAHPSLPNYLELLSGSTQGVGGDGTGYVFASPTLADQLTQANIPWRAYMESMPAACYGGVGQNGGYAKKHNPFMYFTGITGSTECQNVVPLDGFTSDLSSASPPAFVWVTPNLCNDGHDCSTQTMDGWLASHVASVMQTPWFTSGATIIITWDEGATEDGCCNGAHGGHVATLVVSSQLAHAQHTAPVDQAGILRTVEHAYGLTYLGNAACMCSGDIIDLIGTGSAPAQLSWLTAPHLR
jgi:hypothetical protein